MSQTFEDFHKRITFAWVKYFGSHKRYYRRHHYQPYNPVPSDFNYQYDLEYVNHLDIPEIADRKREHEELEDQQEEQYLENFVPDLFRFHDFYEVVAVIPLFVALKRNLKYRRSAFEFIIPYVIPDLASIITEYLEDPVFSTNE